ncbi:sensor histidine kinase [uncultured Meiothermus sp.]|jgi:signal transduction histidine kinase|uniref:sensor histidine kinase n=1 Tax=uncultured Meiothermus sp. TaxID=157471 RepID=UPI00262DD0BF|nr:sensor histidine kinase [uncultured Meiothermus sp.]
MKEAAQQWCYSLAELASMAASSTDGTVLIRRGLEVLMENLTARCGEAYSVRQGRLELEILQNCHIGCAHDRKSIELAQLAQDTQQLIWNQRLVAVPLLAAGQLRGIYVLSMPLEAAPSEEAFLNLGASLVAMGLKHASEVDRLSRREAQRSTLMHQLLFAQEEERRRVGRELHDEVGSHLTGALLALQIAEKRPEYLSEARKAVVQALEEVRRLSRDLRPAVLDDLGLAKALERYLQEYRLRTGIKVQAEIECPNLRESQQIALFRVIQEALTNVARHAQARKVYVGLTAWDRRVRGQVADDGLGFDPLKVPASVGMVGMRERIEQLGGSLNVESTSGKGTRISFVVPV